MAKPGSFGLMLIVPDTSPRNTGIADQLGRRRLGFGTGASFYVDATVKLWRSHYPVEAVNRS